MSAAIAKFKELVLQPEREDAQKRLENRAYWGDTGDWVVRAIMAVEGAINRVPHRPGQSLPDWLDAVLREVEAAHAAFRVEEEDPDGYGSGTFHGALRRIRAFIEAAEADSE
jgi:hypothetical protein